MSTEETSGDDPATRPVVSLMPQGHRRAVAGHPWIFSNEIRMDEAARALNRGALVTLRRADGAPLGVAIFNPHTLLAARLLDRDWTRPIGWRFFARRFERALALRNRLFDQPFYRLCHAEADGLPGLVVDRFGEVIAVEANAAGMAGLEEPILKALGDLLSPAAIVLRGDSPARQLEGLGAEVRVAGGELPDPVLVREEGVTYRIDPVRGQKTGWFYDQRENRAFIAHLSRGVRLLDLYCGAGGFAVAAAVRGAEAVVGIDSSEPALALAAQSAALNGVAERVRFHRGDAFAEAGRLATEGERFAVVVADPPAFAKSRKDLGPALRGYRKLTRLSAALVARAGFLFIATCSYHVGAAEFADAVRRGLADAGRSARILRTAGAGPDHPAHPSLPESAYLKTLTLALD